MRFVVFWGLLLLLGSCKTSNLFEYEKGKTPPTKLDAAFKYDSTYQ